MKKKIIAKCVFVVYALFANYLLAVLQPDWTNALRPGYLLGQHLPAVALSVMGGVIFEVDRLFEKRQARGRDGISLIFSLVFLFFSLMGIWNYTIFATLPPNPVLNSWMKPAFLETVFGFAAGVSLVRGLKK